MVTTNHALSIFRDAALCYAERGLPIFPLWPSTKKPRTSHGFKDATTDPDRIRRWWQDGPSDNIGLATGDVSDTVVIDADGAEGEKSLRELESKLGRLPVTVTQITPGKIKDGQHTGKGWHKIFKMNGQELSCRSGVVKNVDVRANGGYIVMPPSIHPDGTGAYEFAAGLSFDDIEPAELPPAWIEYLRREKKAKRKAVANSKRKVTVGNDLSSATEAIIERCRQEVAQCDPAIEGNGGDKQTFVVACNIFYHWGLSEAEGKPILDEFNARCEPPWSERQLQHKIDSAIHSSSEKPRGWKRLEPIEGEYSTAFGAFVLSPARSLPSALAFHRERYSHKEGSLLLYYTRDFYNWSGNRYEKIHPGFIKMAVLKWLTEAVMVREGKPIKFPANRRTVEDVIEALKSVCLLDDKVQSGTWLGGGEMPPATSLIFTKNCVYNWQTDEKYPCSPGWFNLSCLSTVIDENTPEPTVWLHLLSELWGNDQASKDLLHEYMGLTLTLDTSFQKILLISGPPRAGKGTIFNTLAAIHGEDNVARPSADSLTKNFGLEPLIGKPLAIISDARFVGRDIQIAIERILNISGEDAVTIDIKNRTQATLKLPTRLMIGINGLPKLPDNSGALATRCLPLKLKTSFLGRENRHLGATLLQELPGILKLILKGLRRLHRQGFTETAYQVEFIQDVEELGSPLRAFVRECCELGADKWVFSDFLWNSWLDWSENSGQEGGGRHVWGRNLKATFPEIIKKKKSGKNCYFGIGLINQTLQQEEHSL